MFLDGPHHGLLVLKVNRFHVNLTSFLSLFRLCKKKFGVLTLVEAAFGFHGEAEGVDSTPPTYKPFKWPNGTHE